MRIVSLIPSATEMVCALGFQDQLVGRSHECDFPAGVADLPICTSPRFNPEGSSAEIDQRVKQSLTEALSVYKVHTQVLRDLAPDVIVTQAQCEVCAVSLAEVERAVAADLDSNPVIVSMSPNHLNDVWDDLTRLAQTLGVPEKAKSLLTGYRARLDQVSAAAARAEHRPGVVCIEWLDPLMTAGNWIPTLVEIAGGKSLLAQAGTHSPWVTVDTLIEADPEVLVLLPCGFDMPRTERELHLLTQADWWPQLQAVQNNRVYLTDANQYFNRPGPRLVDSAEILGEILHPDLWRADYEGAAWRGLN